ncbi:MAG TPA: sigma-54 dependent transcriptional regulator [Pyrinomonadaceae bacterium]|nr:sigma-54 dependent transcriptional regulator [Pyrinomonadaceae bacterium]
MVAKSELQPRVFDEFFVRASRIGTDVRDYISFLTEHALRITSSRAAFLTLDSISLQSFDDISDVSRHSYRIIQHTELKSPKSLASLRESINRCMRPQNGPANDYGIMATALPNGLTDEEKIVDLMLTSVCSVWIQLSDDYSPMGWLGLASDKRNAYSDRLLESVNAMLRQGMVALNRLLLREYARQNGRDINLVGQSPKFLQFEQKLKQAASHSRASVLIHGERGAGKELAAYGIHYFSKRREGPFVSVLTPAITESLQADELFGHERSSFTGADKVRKGKFLIAEGGTVFLDEVGNLSPALQSTLLRVLDHGEIQPVGRDLPVNVNVRVVAATNMDLDQIVAEGGLRGDLFDRLNVIELKVPPLRERREDIPFLIRFFLERECTQVSRSERFNKKLICQSCGREETVACVSAGFYEAMQEYDWPGNVREMENIMIRLATMIKGEVLKVHHLPDYILKNSRLNAASPPDDFSLDGAVKEHIRKVLVIAGHNESQAARLLGIPRSTLRSKIKKLDLDNKAH